MTGLLNVSGGRVSVNVDGAWREIGYVTDIDVEWVVDGPDPMLAEVTIYGRRQGKMLVNLLSTQFRELLSTLVGVRTEPRPMPPGAVTWPARRRRKRRR